MIFTHRETQEAPRIKIQHIQDGPYWHTTENVHRTHNGVCPPDSAFSEPD